MRIHECTDDALRGLAIEHVEEVEERRFPERLVVNCPAGVKAALNAEARQRHMTRSEVVRELLVATFLLRQRQAHAALEAKPVPDMPLKPRRIAAEAAALVEREEYRPPIGVRRRSCLPAQNIAT